MPRFVKIVLGVVAAIVLVGIGASVLLVPLTSARVSGNEASAIGSLRSVTSAQMVYSSECGGFAPTLARLAAAGYLAPDLGSDPSVKVGYIIALDRPATAQEVTSAKPGCEHSISEYRATAVPVEPGTTGQRYFITDQTGDLKQATNAGFTDPTPLQ